MEYQPFSAHRVSDRVLGQEHNKCTGHKSLSNKFIVLGHRTHFPLFTTQRFYIAQVGFVAKSLLSLPPKLKRLQTCATILGNFLITNFMKNMTLGANVKELEGFSAYHDCPQWHRDLNRYLSPVLWFGCGVSQSITGWKQPEYTALFSLVSLVLTGEALYHLWDPPAKGMQLPTGPGSTSPTDFLL